MGDIGGECRERALLRGIGCDHSPVDDVASSPQLRLIDVDANGADDMTISVSDP
jgi:hypothetical protein